MYLNILGLLIQKAEISMDGSCLQVIMGKGLLIFMKEMSPILKGYLPVIFLQNNTEMLLNQDRVIVRTQEPKFVVSLNIPCPLNITTSRKSKSGLKVSI